MDDYIEYNEEGKWSGHWSISTPDENGYIYYFKIKYGRIWIGIPTKNVPLYIRRQFILNDLGL